jgi:cytochrome c oxidase cbb3-type subunit 2
MIRRSAVIFTFFFSVSLTLVAASRSHWAGIPAKDHARTNPFAGQPQAVAAGAFVYRDHCQQCHGADAEGRRKSPSLRSGHIQNASDGDLQWFLRQGDIRRGMPSWSALPEAQRWQLVAYLHSIQ